MAPPSRPGKSARAKLAAEVVAALGDVMDMLVQNADILNIAYPRGLVRADGTTTLVLTPMPAHTATSTSAHARLQAEEITTRAQATFETAGDRLARLMPGLALCWEPTPEHPARFGANRLATHRKVRHKLCLADSSALRDRQGGDTLIDTVLKRWKAPLTRLSLFFDDRAAGPGHRWFLFDAGGGGFTPKDTLTAICVHAPDIQTAMRLAAFRHDDGTSVQTPATTSWIAAGREAHALPGDAVVARLKTLMEEARARADSLIAAHQVDVAPAARALADAYAALSCDVEIRLTADLATGAITHSITPLPLASAADLARARVHHAALIDAWGQLADILVRTARELHPRIQDGTLSWHACRTFANRGQGRPPPAVSAMIDGVPTGFHPDTPTDLLETLILLDLCTGSEDTPYLLSQGPQGHAENPDPYGPPYPGGVPAQAWPDGPR